MCDRGWNIVREDRGTFSEVIVEQRYKEAYRFSIMSVYLPASSLSFLEMVNFMCQTDGA